MAYSVMIGKVATWALTYRELVRQRYTGPECLADDVREGTECNLSLLAITGAESATGHDWAVVAALEFVDADATCLGAVGPMLAAYDPFRLEALLHALADDPRPSLRGASWAAPALLRWGEVEHSMAEREAAGVTLSGEQAHDVFAEAYERATGQPVPSAFWVGATT